MGRTVLMCHLIRWDLSSFLRSACRHVKAAKEVLFIIMTNISIHIWLKILVMLSELKPYLRTDKKDRCPQLNERGSF